MPLFRKTISRQSGRLLGRRIDRTFEVLAQVMLVSYALFLFSAWLSSRPSLEIATVEVVGTQAVDPVQVKNVATTLLGEKILWKIGRDNPVLYPREAIASAVGALDLHIKNVDIAVLEQKLVLHVNEYSPTYLWCPSHHIDMETFSTFGCFFADEEGHLFALAPNYSGNPFLVFSAATSADPVLDIAHNSSIYTKEEFAKVKSFLRELAALDLSPRVVRRSGEHDFIISTDKPWTIHWTSTSNPTESVANLALVLESIKKDGGEESELRSIDLRFGNKVFYK